LRPNHSIYVSYAAAFDVIVTADDVEHHKPHPETYALAAERLEVPATECPACENSQAGVESAVAAGMRCVAVPNVHTRAHDFSRADVVMDSLAAVQPLLVERSS